MANRWLREIRVSSSAPSNGIFIYTKMMALFLWKCCGYTWIDQSVTGGNYNSFEKTGAGGFAGSTFQFVRTSGSSFVLADLGKWLLILDSTNPVNNGWYKIIEYIDTNTVAIDFRSLPTEYPTAASGLTWWLMAETYDMPTGNGNYFSVQTPHVDAWWLRIGADTNSYFQLSLSMNANFSGKVISGRSMGSGQGSGNQYLYALANTEGDMFHTWQFNKDDHSINSSGNSLASVMPVVPVESGHLAIERWVLAGRINQGYIGRRNGDNWGWSKMWCDRKNAQYDMATLDWTTGGNNNGSEFLATSGVDVNLRVGKTEFWEGTWCALDHDNSIDVFEAPYGLIKKHYTTNNRFIPLTPLTILTPRDAIYIKANIALPWPGVTPQF